VKVLICGGHPYESQANRQVRHSICDGWVELLGETDVISTNVEDAACLIPQIRPDLVLATGSYLPESTYFGELSHETRGLGTPAVFWATEDPYEHDASYRITHDFDVIFSCDRSSCRFYEHDNVFHLPLAGCRRSFYSPIDPWGSKEIDVVFCGVAFANRQEIVKDIRDRLTGHRLCFIGPGWGKFGMGFSDPRIERAELIYLYRKSRIVLNLGRSLHFENRRYMITPSTPGPRTFEAALVGCVQLFFEDTYEIRHYFKQEELPCFSNGSEFGRLLESYLSDERLASHTASLAQARALKEHTYRHRAEAVVTKLKELRLL
jgi:spore maturation protein CgeB